MTSIANERQKQRLAGAMRAAGDGQSGQWARQRERVVGAAATAMAMVEILIWESVLVGLWWTVDSGGLW